MKFYLRLVILFFLPVAMWAQSLGLPEVTQWPENRTAAISLTFDDALMSQLHNAAPAMEKSKHERWPASRQAGQPGSLSP
jgi:hypothetical protein